jgi:hypothetical protein
MRVALCAILIAGGTTAQAFAAGDEAGMAAAANGFYAVYRTVHPSDGIPSPADRAKYAPYLSAALERLLADAGDAEERFAKANKASPPLVEGDLFTSLFEGATSEQVGSCTGDGKIGHCRVNLEYTEPGSKPTEWTDTIHLLNSPNGWRVDDIAYGGSWAFGNKGRLSETLRQTIGFQ